MSTAPLPTLLFTTTAGAFTVELSAVEAPESVANFLQYADDGHFDGTLFHRVIPGFMIQGGDPQGTGMGNGPRRLNAEFSSEPHVRGILSMARTGDPN